MSTQLQIHDYVKVPEVLETAPREDYWEIHTAIKGTIARLRARNWEAGRAARAAIWAARKLYGWGTRPAEWSQVVRGASDFYWGNWYDYAKACDPHTLTNRHWVNYPKARVDRMVEHIDRAADRKHGHHEMLVQVQ